MGCAVRGPAAPLPGAHAAAVRRLHCLRCWPCSICLLLGHGRDRTRRGPRRLRGERAPLPPSTRLPPTPTSRGNQTKEGPFFLRGRSCDRWGRGTARRKKGLPPLEPHFPMRRPLAVRASMARSEEIRVSGETRGHRGH